MIDTWTSLDRSTLVQFLIGPTGQKFIEHLRASAPRPKTVADTLEKSALQSERYFGWIACLEQIDSLTLPHQGEVNTPKWVEPEPQPAQNPL